MRKFYLLIIVFNILFFFNVNCCFAEESVPNSSTVLDGLNSLETGTCGENLIWIFDGNGILTISGNGDMDDYEQSYNRDPDISVGSTAPWNSFKNSISAVNIQPGVTSIGKFAFSGLFNLQNCIIPSTVKSIGGYAFYRCEKMTTISIPSTVLSIGGSAFLGCAGMTQLSVDSNNPQYCAENGILYNKAKTELLYCLTGMEGIVTIPDSVTVIGGSAFVYCIGLTNITLSSNLTTIGTSAFMGCEGLTSIILPNGLTSINQLAFANCQNLTSVYIPASVMSIGIEAFARCYNLTGFDVDPQNAQYSSRDGVLYNKAFTELIMYPDGLSGHYTIPNGVVSIAICAFDFCYDLTSLTIPESITSINEYNFPYGSSFVLKIVNNLYAETFAINHHINYVVISGTVSLSVKSPIQHFSLRSKQGLMTVVLDGMDSETYRDLYGSMIWTSSNTDVLSFTEQYYWNMEDEARLKINLTGVGVTKVTVTSRDKAGSSTECTVIVHDDDPAILPIDSTLIHMQAFENTGFEEVVLLDNVIEIGSEAFKDCANLKLITIPDTVINFGSDIFSGCKDLTILCSSESSPACSYAKEYGLQYVAMSS